MNTSQTKLFLTTTFMVLLLSACTTPVSQSAWPRELPPRALFIEGYERQVAAGTNTNNLDNHLLWIVRFYEGSILYPVGWNQITEMLLDTIENASLRASLTERMRQLGTTIAIEWAQDNRSRLIDSAAVAVWGNSLRTAAERGEQDFFVSKVETDVAAILSGDLSSKEIVRERYYPPEDYDNF